MAKKEATGIKVSFEMSIIKKNKGSVRFGSDSKEAQETVSNIYFMNTGLSKMGNPEKIKITLESAE